MHFPNQGPVPSLAPLRSMPALTSIAIGSGVLDGDLTPLLDLPATTSVGPVDAFPGHSHTDKQIRAARQARS
ncbi:hypothetical protein [Alloactinosynnema sp. L-07]|nr:hypothetical protein [Alloactinosynnema sp. L-07]